MNDSTRRVILLISLFSFCSGLLFAQGTGALKGRVIDALTNDPLPSANIVIQDPFLGTITDLNGDYILNNVPAGSQTIHVS